MFEQRLFVLQSVSSVVSQLSTGLAPTLFHNFVSTQSTTSTALTVNLFAAHNSHLSRWMHVPLRPQLGWDFHGHPEAAYLTLQLQQLLCFPLRPRL